MWQKHPKYKMLLLKQKTKRLLKIKTKDGKHFGSTVTELQMKKTNGFKTTYPVHLAAIRALGTIQCYCPNIWGTNFQHSP